MSCGAGRKPSRERRIIGEAKEIEYWVLELAHELRISLSFLTSANFGALFNVRFDGFERVELVAGLERLFAAGDLDVREGDVPRVLGRAAIEEALDRPVPPPPRCTESLEPFYGLTAQGGARWEAWARADWEKYNPLSYDERDGVDYGEITALDRGRAEMFLVGVRNYLTDDFAYEGPEEWDLLIPWDATYWKTLVRGHRVRFRCRPAQALRLGPDPTWFRDFWTWYQRPFGP